MAAVPFQPRSHLCESRAEENASRLTHGAGTVFALVALVAMILTSLGDPAKIVASSIYGTTLVMLYASSTIYHHVTSPRTKSFFQILDHSCIYLLIAGSYTPLCLVTLRGPWGWSLLGIVWGLAIGGVVLKASMRGKRETWWSTALYLLMGWLIILAAGPILRALSPTGIAWLVAGGLGYTIGIGFFLWSKLPYNHAIWHLFVLAGSACHVMATNFHILRG